ncbi:MAG TPA: tetratricopeptide repeat protein [Polyangiaceae bacterium]|nr:tetratricopeptide repeat protein [Polyangiaceae bacterium]
MEPTTTWSRAVGRSSDLQGSLLLTNAALLLIGAWVTLGFAPALPDAADVVTERHPLALEAYDDACGSGDASACNNLGVSYHNGYGTDRDDAAALALFTRACSAGSADACNNQAALLQHALRAAVDGPAGGSTAVGSTAVGSAAVGSAAALESARGSVVLELYRRACASGSGLGCSNLGALYANGEGVPLERRHARALFERACQLGSVVGCENLASIASADAASAAN